MTINKYIGSRYVPLYIGVHNENKSYEPLSIVSNEAKTETYTSTQAVPVGIELNNETYWVQSGWSNADMKITTENDFVDSTTNSSLSAEKTDDGYKLKLSDSNAFASGGTLDTAQTLNTMLDTGRYIFKPVDCAGVPDAIASLETPAELEITDYIATEGATAQLMQKITAYDDDDAAMFVRTYDNEKWSDWKMIGGNGGGSYTLPVASATTLGGVKIGSGVNVTSDGTISVSGGSGGIGEWVEYTAATIPEELGNSNYSYIEVNQYAKLCHIHLSQGTKLGSNTAINTPYSVGASITGLPAPNLNGKDELTFSCATTFTTLGGGIGGGSINNESLYFNSYMSLYNGGWANKWDIYYPIA